MFLGGGFGFITLGLILLAALTWPASVRAQAGTPPPVHSFDLEQGAEAAESDSDELILIDLFDLPDGASPPEPSPMPSLPPQVAPVASAPPAASPPSTDSGPPAGPPLVNLPPTAIPAKTAPQAPPESVPPVQVPAGYTPLPTVPLQSAPEPLTDPFARPPLAEPEAVDPGLPAVPADNRTVPLGQAQSLPAPQWEGPASETTPSQSQIISGAPLPQFDASQSNWIQLEIGQGDSSGPASPASARPTSVYSLPDPAVKPLEPAPVPAGAAVDAALDQAISQPPAAAGRNLNSPDGREYLRNLFPEFVPPEGQGVRVPGVKPPASGGQAPASAGTPPKTAPPPKLEPAPGKNDEDVGSSAILKAGGLLTLDERFGAAEILPPLGGRPRWPAPETPAKPVPAPKAAVTKPEPPAVASAIENGPLKAASQPAAKPAPAKSAPAKSSGSGQAKKGGSKKPGGGTPAAPAGVGLIIINDTGRDRVGQQYRSVLAQMGYKVVSVSDGKPDRGTAGQTVINYRPGLKAQAQAVARHLPGKKALSEAKKGQVLASEIMIYIR